MPLQQLHFTITIAAPAARVHDLMIAPDGYQQWTAPFGEGSHFEGSWAKGDRIRFLGPSGDGMLAEIAEHLPNTFLSIRHLGFIANGVEDTGSAAVRTWGPAYENYTFTGTADGTILTVDQDVAPEWADDLAAAWPKALASLKALCEDGTPA